MTIDFPSQTHIPGLRQLWQAAFGDTDAFLDRFFTTGFSPYRCLCIRQGAQVLAALYWFDCHWQDKRIAYLYAVATAPTHRGQGLCRKLMHHTHEVLLQLGYSGTVLVPSSTALFSMYEKLGYVAFGGIRQWTCSAAATPAELKPISYPEYALARQAYLPENSVLQTGAILRFLSTYARFYQGKDFLVCIAEDSGNLTAPELLGDPDAAAHILAALGASRGTFRCPGTAPFAMYHTLTPDTACPDYFAFALD